MTKEIFAVLVALLLTHGSDAVAQNPNWLNAFERGSLGVLDAHTAELYKRLKRAENSVNTTLSHRRQGAGHDHFFETERDVCQVTVAAMNLSRRQSKQHTVVYPATLRPLRAAYQDILDLGARYPSIKRCDDLSFNQQWEFVRAARKMRAERTQLKSIVSDRYSRRGYESAQSFSLEFTPFKVEFIDGSLKMKVGSSIGRVKWDYQIGFKKSQRKQYNGPARFDVYTPDRKIYRFDVRGMDFDASMPAGLLQVRGPVLIFRCTEACTEQFGPFY